MPTREQILRDTGFVAWYELKGVKDPDRLKDIRSFPDEELLQLYKDYYMARGVAPPWEITPAPTPTPTKTPTAQQQADYNDYLAFIKQYPELGLPVPKDIWDFIENQEKWMEEFAPPEEPEPEEPKEPLKPGEPGYKYTNDQYREFNTYRNYASAYGDPADWYPVSIDDYFKNHDTALKQLADWKAKKKAEYTDDQKREYNTYKQYASAYGDPKDWYAISIDDYFKNYDTAQEQLREWKEEEKGAEKPEYTDAQNREYNTYRRYASSYGDPADWYALSIDDYFKNHDVALKQLADWKTEEKAEEKAEYTDAQKREFNTYRNYASAYGDPADWYPVSIDDYFKNHDTAQEQLTKWKQREKDKEQPEYTSDQNREFNTYKRYASAYGDPKDWYAISIKDYLENYDEAQGQLAKWRQEEIEEVAKRGKREAELEEERAKRKAEEEEYEKWRLPPEEQARRREESYQQSLESRARAEYAAQEAYGETPQYQEPFVSWLTTQGDKSMALQEYIESKYPSLRTQYEATQPRLTGYPTREGARAEAGRRERGFQAWLPTQLPTVESEFWEQPPAQRGERPSAFAWKIRHAAW